LIDNINRNVWVMHNNKGYNDQNFIFKIDRVKPDVFSKFVKTDEKSVEVNALFIHQN